MKEEKNNTLFIIALIGILIFVFWPTIEQTVMPLAEPAKELTITIVNQSEQVQSVIMPEPPTIQPQPVQQAQPVEPALGEIQNIAPQFVPADAQEIEFWEACAAGQAAGRRVSPRCPANAARALAEAGR